MIIREVAKLHLQLGHPSPQALSDYMAHAGYDKEYLSCARAYDCAACLANQLPKNVRVASIPKAKFTNHILQIDTLHVRYHGAKKILAVQDEYSRYEVGGCATETGDLEG